MRRAIDLHLGWVFLLVGLLSVGEVNAQGFKLYGNWCGPKHGHKGDPVDAVDNACKHHDLCCERNREYPFSKKVEHCDCDKIILQKTAAAMQTKLSAKGRAAGAAIISYFSNAPCYCYKNVCVSKPKCKTEKSCKKVAGKNVCVSKPKCKTEKVCKRTPLMGRGGRCP
jgi:hypothetical protein